MGETERSRAEVGVWLLAGLAFVVGTVELVVAGVLDELAATSSRLASNRAKLGAAALARLAPTNANSAPASRRRRSMPALR